VTAWQIIAVVGILAVLLLGLVALGQPQIAVGILLFLALVVFLVIL